MKTRFLQYLHLMLPAFLQKFLRKLPVRNYDVNLFQTADVKAGFQSKLAGIHQYNYLIRLPDCGFFENRFIPDAATKACGRVIACNAQEHLMKVHTLQLLDGRKAKNALTIAVQLPARKHNCRPGQIGKLRGTA